MPARTFALVWIQSGFDVKMPKLLKLLSKQIYQSRASLNSFVSNVKTLCVQAQLLFLHCLFLVQAIITTTFSNWWNKGPKTKFHIFPIAFIM